MVTDNRGILKSDQNRYSLTYLNFDSLRFNISHAPISEAGAAGVQKWVPLLSGSTLSRLYDIRNRAIFIKMDDADGYSIELLIHLFSAPQWRILSQFETGCF